LEFVSLGELLAVNFAVCLKMLGRRVDLVFEPVLRRLLSEVVLIDVEAAE